MSFGILLKYVYTMAVWKCQIASCLVLSFCLNVALNKLFLFGRRKSETIAGQKTAEATGLKVCVCCLCVACIQTSPISFVALGIKWRLRNGVANLRWLERIERDVHFSHLFLLATCELRDACVSRLLFFFGDFVSLLSFLDTHRNIYP